MIQDDSKQKISLKARFAKHAQDFDDLQHEMAGRDVGRIARFLNADAREDKINGKRGSRKDADLTNLQIMMMNNPAYAALYRETEKTLRDAQTRLDEMLDAVSRAKEEAQERLNGKLSDTARAEEETRLEALTELESDIRTGQADIGDMQLRMQDQKNPTSAEEMKGFEDYAEKFEADATERLEQFSRRELTASENHTVAGPQADVVVPKL